MKAILIIEDKREELTLAIAAVKKRLGVTKTGLGIEADAVFGEKPWPFGFEHLGDAVIVYANHLLGAEEALRFVRGNLPENSGEMFILTDLMFPLREGGAEQANGVGIILDAVNNGVPVAVCSDTDHHQVTFLPKLCSHLKQSSNAKIEIVLDKKDWGKAVDLLFGL